MKKIENIIIRYIIIVIAGDKNPSLMVLKLVLKAWWKIGHLYTLKISPYKIFINNKRKKWELYRKNLADTSLTKYSKLTSPVIMHKDIMCFLICCNEKVTTSFLWNYLKNTKIHNLHIRQTPAEGHSTKELAGILPKSQCQET